MKTGFSFSKRYVPSFHGNQELPESEQLVAVLKMPTVQDIFAILDRIASMGLNGRADNSKLSMQQATEIAREGGQYIPKYIELENAEDFTVTDVITYPPFFALAAELLFALVQFAQPSKDDEKN